MHKNSTKQDCHWLSGWQVFFLWKSTSASERLPCWDTISVSQRVTLPRRGTWSKCLQGSLTIHGSTSLLMGPTTILIIDVVIDSVVLPPLTGAAEFTCMTLFIAPTPWPFLSHLPSVSEISVILHLSFVICRADRAFFLPLSAGRWWTAVRWAYADDEARDAAGRKLH